MQTNGEKRTKFGPVITSPGFVLCQDCSMEQMSHWQFHKWKQIGVLNKYRSKQFEDGAQWRETDRDCVHWSQHFLLWVGPTQSSAGVAPRWKEQQSLGPDNISPPHAHAPQTPQSKGGSWSKRTRF